MSAASANLPARGRPILSSAESRNSAAAARAGRPRGTGGLATDREPAGAPRRATSELRSEREELACANDFKKPLDALSEKMSRYENANTPPPADSL